MATNTALKHLQVPCTAKAAVAKGSQSYYGFCGVVGMPFMVFIMSVAAFMPLS